MIPCYICGKDASTVWTKGFAPAPDSQKMALCAEHNTPENRVKVIRAWHKLLEQDVIARTEVAQFKADAPSLKTANVHFTGGGMLSFVCTECAPTPQGTLRIQTPDGGQTFVPMQHIREYTVLPYLPEEKPRTNRETTQQPAALAFPASQRVALAGASSQDPQKIEEIEAVAVK